MKDGYEKRFSNGDVVYFRRQDGNRHEVAFAIVDEQFSDVVCVDYVVFKEDRFVDGVPIDEVPTIGKWRKLPKGWSYDTRLFEISTKIDEDYPVGSWKDPVFISMHVFHTLDISLQF